MFILLLVSFFTGAVLQAMGINNLIDFDFMDAPPLEAMLTALHELHTLSALDNDGLLLKLGRRVSRIDIEHLVVTNN